MNDSVTGSYERVRLGQHHPVSQTTIHGWPSVWFGIPFAGIGGFVMGIGLGIVPVKASSVHAPMWVIGVAGLAFFGAGMSLIVHGLKGVKRKAKMDEGKRNAPNSPWLWDYTWEKSGAAGNKLAEVRRYFIGALAFAVFISIFNWVAFYLEDDVPVWVKGVVVFFDLIILLVLYEAFRKLAQYLKYGDSQLRFKTFPFTLGEKMIVSLQGAPTQFDIMKINLRFVEENYETHGTGKNRSQRVVCYQVYGEEKILRSHDAGKPQIYMEWVLPDDPNLTSALSERPARFWELEVKAETPGVDYETRFLVPVYARG